MDDVKLAYKNLEFNGIKLSKDGSSLPWNTKRQKNILFDSLIKEASEVSQRKYKDLERQNSIDDIHISLSRSLISKMIYIACLTLSVFAILFSNGNIETLYLAFPILAIVGFYAERFFKNTSSKKYIDLESGITDSFVDLIFANERDEIQ